MTWAEEIKEQNKAFHKSVVKMKEEQRKSLSKMIDVKKGATTMRVSYNGFTGELVKLEKKFDPYGGGTVYDLSIYDSEKQVTHSFTGVQLEDVKFLGGVVSFGA